MCSSVLENSLPDVMVLMATSDGVWFTLYCMLMRLLRLLLVYACLGRFWTECLALVHVCFIYKLHFVLTVSDLLPSY